MFGFLRPEFLIATPLVLGVLVYAYLNRGKHTVRRFGSLIFLKDFQTKIRKRSKITLPPRLFFELIALLLILCAASGIFIDQQGRKIAFVFDNSLSTASVSTTHGAIDAYLAEQAKEALSEYSLADVVDLYITNSPSKNRTGLSVRSVESALYHVEPEYGSDGLERLLSQSTMQEYDLVTVISDKQYRGAPDARFDFWPRAPIQDAIHNTAIERAVLREVGGERMIAVSIRSFSDRKTNPRISVFSLDEGGQETLIRESSIEVSPGQSLTREISVGSQIPSGYKITLTFSSLLDDQLARDNIYFLSGDGAQSEEVVYVGDLEPESLNLSAIKRFLIRGIKPIELTRYSQKHTPRFYIFHRYVPDTLPKGSALFVAPQRNSGLFAVTEGRANLELSRWLSAHPITNYLNVSLLKLPTASIIQAEPWQEIVFSTTEGAVLTAGETRGSRYVVSGFELFPFEGKNSPFLSVLTLNVLEWLNEAQINTGEDGAEIKNARVLASGMPLGDRLYRDVPGLYSITLKNDEKRIATGSFYDSTESDLKNKTLSFVPEVNVPKGELKGATSEKSFITWILTALLLCIVVADAIYLYMKGSLLGLR